MSDAYIRDPEKDLTYDSNTGSYVLTSSLVKDYTLTIVPSPSDATVTLTAEGYTQLGNSITVPEGFTVIYSVVKPGYSQKRDSIVVNSDITLNVTLDQAEVDIIDESTTVKELEVNSTVYDIVGKGILDQNTKTTQLEWFGTLDEYKALGEYSDYCTYYITDDLGISNEYDLGHLTEIINDFDVDTFKPEVDAIKNEAISDINEATSNSVEQLKNMGEVVNYTNITNCITDIPQDIKLEIVNGVLTLKSGSSVYIPNGPNAFMKKTSTEDVITHTGTYTGKFMIFDNGSLTSNSLRISGTPYQFSGTTAPSSPQTDTTWYDTTNNIVKVYQNSQWTGQRTLPLAIATFESGVCVSIDQVFNGFGYIGSTVFALPGVKGLIPNGRNLDGSLNNEEITVTDVTTYTAAWSTFNYTLYLGYNDSGIVTINGGIESDCIYDNNLNINKVSGSYYRGLNFINIKTTSDKIENYIGNTSFHAVDYSDFKKVYSMIMPDYSGGVTLSANVTYTATVPGWILWRADNTQQGALTISGTYMAGAGGIINKWADYNSIFVPVDMGDTYHSSGHSYFAFYPCKGVK